MVKCKKSESDLLRELIKENPNDRKVKWWKERVIELERAENTERLQDWENEKYFTN